MPRHEPERTCIVTREVRPPTDMIRFVLGPESQVVADLKHKLPGRGVWVTAQADKVAEAVRRRGFGRAFKAEVKVAPTLAEDIDAALVADLRQALALANKAGVVITGFMKVEAAAREKPLAAVVHASEAAPDGRRKLAGALRNRLGDAISALPVVDVLSGAELDLALGRSNVIHAALVAGRGSDAFLTLWHRLRAYRGVGADQAGLPRDAGDPDRMNPQESERNE